MWAVNMTKNDFDTRCPRCDGCGMLADTEDKEPWSDWMALPLRSSHAVLLGVVRPILCPDCNGTGQVGSLQDAKRRLFGWLRRIEHLCNLYPECPGQCPGCKRKARLNEAMILIDELTKP